MMHLVVGDQRLPTSRLTACP